MRKLVLFAIVVASVASGCAADAGGGDGGDDTDLDNDPDLTAILGDGAEDLGVVDGDTAETMQGATVECTKERYLHVANWSWVPPIGCIDGVCPNGCWGFQRRTSGFTCDYKSTEADYIKTTDEGGAFASYNEIKSLNAHDAAAVANCRSQSGHPVRTYVVWNGSGWNNEGIGAAVQFAEVYGTQAEAQTRFWTWYNGSARGSYAPMGNVSPETGQNADEVKALTARLCSATRVGWAGLYFYDGNASGGAGMANWKLQAIIRGMNYCTTH